MPEIQYQDDRSDRRNCATELELGDHEQYKERKEGHTDYRNENVECSGCTMSHQLSPRKRNIPARLANNFSPTYHSVLILIHKTRVCYVANRRFSQWSRRLNSRMSTVE